MNIGIIGDYDEKRQSHLALNEALRHSAKALGMEAGIHWLATMDLESAAFVDLDLYDAFWCAPGSPYRSMTGALRAIRHARENDLPFLGTCGGFQHAILEYAIHELGMQEARHAENEPGADILAITPLACPLTGVSQQVFLVEGSMCHRIYGEISVKEFFNCSYGINPTHLDAFCQSGFMVSGRDGNGEPRIMELSQHRFYVATLFQPQFGSAPDRPHPLILQLLRSA